RVDSVVGWRLTAGNGGEDERQYDERPNQVHKCSFCVGVQGLVDRRGCSKCLPAPGRTFLKMRAIKSPAADEAAGLMLLFLLLRRNLSSAARYRHVIIIIGSGSFCFCSYCSSGV